MFFANILFRSQKLKYLLLAWHSYCRSVHEKKKIYFFFKLWNFFVRHVANPLMQWYMAGQRLHDKLPAVQGWMWRMLQLFHAIDFWKTLFSISFPIKTVHWIFSNRWWQPQLFDGASSHLKYLFRGELEKSCHLNRWCNFILGCLCGPSVRCQLSNRLFSFLKYCGFVVNDDYHELES